MKEESALGGIYDFNARFYDPAIGRFLSVDTIVPRPSDPQSLNRFSFVRNNPLNRVDPSGHEPCEAYGADGSESGCIVRYGATTPQLWASMVDHYAFLIQRAKNQPAFIGDSKTPRSRPPSKSTDYSRWLLTQLHKNSQHEASQNIKWLTEQGSAALYIEAMRMWIA
jgi:RHS repeat-associated protein